MRNNQYLFTFSNIGTEAFKGNKNANIITFEKNIEELTIEEQAFTDVSNTVLKMTQVLKTKLGDRVVNEKIDDATITIIT